MENGKDLFHLPEHDQDFSVQNARLQLFKDWDSPDKFRLSLNGQNIIDWFKQKGQEVKQTTRPHIKPQESGKTNILRDNCG